MKAIVQYIFTTLEDKKYKADVTGLDNIHSFIRLTNVKEILPDGTIKEIGPILWLNKNNVKSVKPE